MPRRTIAWSSTTNNLIVIAPPFGRSVDCAAVGIENITVVPRPCDEDTSAQPPSPRARSIIPLTPKPGVTCRLLVSNPSPSSADFERDLVAEREQLHMNVLGARVFANVGQRLLRHAIHRGGAVRGDLELFPVCLKIDLDSAALGKAAREPFERGDEPGIEHGGPQ